jgi:hypothetical protein
VTLVTELNCFLTQFLVPQQVEPGLTLISSFVELAYAPGAP